MHCLKWCLYDNQVIRSTINIRVKGYGENSSYYAIFKTTADICSAHSSPINLTHSYYIYLIKKVSCVNYLMGDYESLTLIPIYTQSQINRYPTPGSECMHRSRRWTRGADLSLKIHNKHRICLHLAYWSGSSQKSQSYQASIQRWAIIYLKKSCQNWTFYDKTICIGAWND